MKNLCICQWGHSRSVALARLLHSKKQAAVAIGTAANGDAITILSEWADRIFTLGAAFAEYVPAEHRHKIVLFDVGADRWVNPYHPELRNILEKMYAERFGEN